MRNYQGPLLIARHVMEAGNVKNVEVPVIVKYVPVVEIAPTVTGVRSVFIVMERVNVRTATEKVKPAGSANVISVTEEGYVSTVRDMGYARPVRGGPTALSVAETATVKSARVAGSVMSVKEKE